MFNTIKTTAILLLLLGLNSCENRILNVDEAEKDGIEAFELNNNIDNNQIQYEDIFYIPIYSDIYASKQNLKSPLATL